MADLVLALKEEYFVAIRDGQKPEEFRLYDDYWRKRIEGKSFDRIVLTWGYPKSDNAERRIFRKWNGYRVTTITHPHFGNVPTEVFAIDVTVEDDTIVIDGVSYRKFIRYPEEITDGTFRCMRCGQIDEDGYHDDEICIAAFAQEPHP